MEEKRKVLLSSLADMFKSFDDDVIESVLEARDWDTDRALDDLMQMQQGTTFYLPEDDVTADPMVSNFHTGDPLSQQINFVSYNNKDENDSDNKNGSEDDIIVVNEEEFCLSAESESEEEARPPAAPISQPTYASVAKKPPTYEEISHIKPPSIVFKGSTSFERVKRTRDSIERVKIFVREGFKIMVILRGCSGSGKTTLGKRILTECQLKGNRYWYMHSSDNYFHLNDKGTYQYDRTKIPEAHKWNEVNVLHVVRDGLTPVIIDNTNTRIWEMEAYAKIAVCAGYEIEVIEPDNPWSFDINQLARKNIHMVDRQMLAKMLERYEYNVSSSLLLKTFKLEYSPIYVPPQRGNTELTNKELISLFEDLYNTIHVFPVELKKLKKQQKPCRKAKKKQRQLEDRELDELVNEIENCHESADDTELDNYIVKSFAEHNLATDSDKSWEDITDESCSVESQNSSSDSSDESDIESSSSEEISENETDKIAAQPAECNSDMNCVNKMVDSFKNPINLDADALSVDVNFKTKDKFSNRLYDALSKTGPRLKCFEMLHDEDIENVDDVADPSIIQSVTKIIDELTPPISPPFCESDSPDAIVEKILNNALCVEDKKHDCAEIVEPVLLPDSIEPINDTGFSETIETNEPQCDILQTNVHTVDAIPDEFNSLNSTLATPEVTVIYNEPDKLVDTKSNKSFKNINAGNSTEDERCSLFDEAKRITGNNDTDITLSYRYNLNDGADLFGEPHDQIVSSSKFKEQSNAARNVIENDLWGDSFQDNGQTVERNRRVSENSENSDYGTNSSSSDEVRIEDVHNSVNRFVNNDIKSDQTEKKKSNINFLKSKNSAEDEIAWSMDSTVELNTLKERILVNSLDKVFNQTRSTEETPTVECGDLKSTNISRKSSATGFQLIENRLNDRVEIEHNLFDTGVSVEPAESDRTESKFWNQWMKGDSWEDTDKESKSTEAKPPRKHESPSKQKNTETSNIRLINDIKPCDKNINQAKLKTINFESITNDYFKFRSYPNTEDSLFGLPAAYDGNLKNFNVHDSKDSYFALNTLPKKSNDDDDTERCKTSWTFTDNVENIPSSYVDPRRSPYRNFPKKDNERERKIEDEPKPRRKNVKKIEDNAFVDELVERWKSIAKEDSPLDYDKVLKWGPLNDTGDADWTEDTVQNERKLQRVQKSNFFVPEDLLNQQDKSTNTGTDDVTEMVSYMVARSREINEERDSPTQSVIETKMRCEKSTMTEPSNYTVKAKPIREDLFNMFPKNMADTILDLYEKCNGNMDWIMEILLEDGYSPTDDQLEYLSSLQNVVKFDAENIEKNKPSFEKKKKYNGKARRNNCQFDDKEGIETKKIKRKRIDEKQKSPEHEPTDVLINGDLNDEENDKCVELFLDTTTVQQLVGYFGNPTIYSLKDCQPVINLPISLARQIHAYLLESIISQAERNESLINQLAEEELIIDEIPTVESTAEISQNDMIEVENSLSDVINSETVRSATSEDSFASKLSLDLLLKSFPTVDPCFVTNTFKSNKCNYYETKEILNQIRPEVPTDLLFNLDSGSLVERTRSTDVPLFETTSSPRDEILDQVSGYRDEADFNYGQWQKFNEQLKIAVQRKRFGVAPYYRELMSAFKQKYDECNAKAAAVLINSCCLKNSNVIDLHFFKVTEALRALDIFLDHHISRLANAGRAKTTLYIITGRGSRNNDGVSHLQPPVKSRLKKRNIEFDVQPSNTGLVVAVVRKSSPLTDNL